MSILRSRRRRPGTTVARLVLGLTLIAPLAAGCQSALKQDPAALRSAIEAANRRFAEAFARKDGPALGLLYAEDAQAFPPGAQPAEGRAAIEAMWTAFLALPLSEVQLQTVDVGGDGETTWEAGRYTLLGSDGKVTEAGKYVVIWEHDESGWKLYRDIWNSNTPAAAPASDAAPSAAK